MWSANKTKIIRKVLQFLGLPTQYLGLESKNEVKTAGQGRTIARFFCDSKCFKLF